MNSHGLTKYLTFNDFIDIGLNKEENGDSTYILHILDLYLEQFLKVKGL